MAAQATWALRPRHSFVPWVRACMWGRAPRLLLLLLLGCHMCGWVSCACRDCSQSNAPHAGTLSHTLAPTHSLQPTRSDPPPKQMTVNGVAIGSDFERLERYVCAAAPASGRPQACYVLSPALANQRGLSG